MRHVRRHQESGIAVLHQLRLWYGTLWPPYRRTRRQATARELWDLVGEIVENQVSEHLRQASCEKRGTLLSMCEALLV